MVLLLLLLSMEFVGFGFCGWWCFGVAEGFCVVTIVVCVVVVVFVVNNVGVCTCGWCSWWCLWGFGFSASGVVVFVCCFACVRVGHVHPPLFILYFFPGKILSPSREVAWWSPAHVRSLLACAWFSSQADLPRASLASHFSPQHSSTP